MLLKPEYPLGPIPVADFKIEKLQLGKVADNLCKYFSRIPADHRGATEESWRTLLSRLEALPTLQGTFPEISLAQLPKCEEHPVVAEIPDHFQFVEDEVDKRQDIIGNIHPRGLFDGLIKVGITLK